MKKCVVVLSGGPDSTTVLFWARNQGYDVYPITFNYGQIATKEIQQAAIISKEIGVPHKIIDFSSLKDIYTGVTSLIDRSIPMTPEFSEPIIVPFRNGIFLAASVAYAVSIGANYVFYGAQGSDDLFYPDCRKEFYKAFENAAKLGTDQPIIIEAPFSEMKKSEMLKKGKELGVPFHLTWSCYFNESIHCGVCESCMNRKRAFSEAKLSDPTKYSK